MLWLGLLAVGVLAAGCGVGPAATPTATPEPMHPEDVMHGDAPDHIRRDLDNGVVAAQDAYGDGRAVYVTHVPTGAQIVLDGDGAELERHVGGDGLQAIEAALADEAMRAQVVGMLAKPGPNRDACIADYIPAMEFDGVHYVGHVAGAPPPALTPDLLGPARYRVAFRMDCAGVGFGYQAQEGDATFLPPGTLVYEVVGYDPSFRLAAGTGDTYRIYEATANAAAQVGEDMLDIRGKVTRIDVLSEQDAETVLGTIDDARNVEFVMERVLASPVDQQQQERSFERHFLAFRLNDGTSVVRAFWPETGELHRGIMTDPGITMAVLNALPDDHRPQQHWDGPRVTEGLAVRLARAFLTERQPDSVVARQMTLGESAALGGASYGPTIDATVPVWFVEFSGSFPDIRSGDTYPYASVVIDAEGANFHSSGLSHGSLLGTNGGTPLVTPTPTLTPTPTSTPR